MGNEVFGLQVVRRGHERQEDDRCQDPHVLVAQLQQRWGKDVGAEAGGAHQEEQEAAQDMLYGFGTLSEAPSTATIRCSPLKRRTRTCRVYLPMMMMIIIYLPCLPSDHIRLLLHGEAALAGLASRTLANLFETRAEGANQRKIPKARPKKARTQKL